MCELLGMSANVPTDICFSFTGLVLRGGNTGPHSDGWGLVFYDGKGVRVFKDPEPCATSKLAEMLRDYSIKSCAVISHIRQANFGAISLANTHPFTRELWGEYWTFAHNGQLRDITRLTTKRFIPVGQTDSEAAFCWLLDELAAQFPVKPQDMTAVFRFIHLCCVRLRELGVFNMLLSNGEYIITYCTTKLCHITRRAPFGKASLIDEDMTVDFQQQTTPNDVVTVIATTPLTYDEQWRYMGEGECIVFQLGESVFSAVK